MQICRNDGYKDVCELKIVHIQGAGLEEMRMHTILKPTMVHEASLKIWQNFAATKSMGEF